MVVLDRPAVVVAAMNGTMLEDHEVSPVIACGGESNAIANDARLHRNGDTTDVVVLERPAVVVAVVNGTMLEDHEVPSGVTGGGESEANANDDLVGG